MTCEKPARRRFSFTLKTLVFRITFTFLSSWSLSDLPTNIVFAAKISIPMEEICLDRLLKQRSALPKPDILFDFPPPRGVLTQNTQIDTEVLARRSRNQSNGVETQSAQRLGSSAQRNASASVTSFELRALCDEIGLRHSGLGSLSVAAVCLAAGIANPYRTFSQSPTNS